MKQLNTHNGIYVRDIKRLLTITLVLFAAFLIASCAAHNKPAAANKISSAEALADFNRLVDKDAGLTSDEKDHWKKLARETFEGKSFSYDYSNLIYDIFSQAKFDEVAIETAAQVAFASAKAVNRGAPMDEVSDLALLAFSVSLTSDEIRLYAITSRKSTEAGVPTHVTQEMVRNAKEDTWTEHSFTTIMNGLMQAAKENLDTEKVGLFMLISVAQNLGTPERIVEDALNDGRKRASVKPLKKSAEPVKKTDSPKAPKIALDYDSFRGSVESFLGTPYVWGGNTRTGVDCSGFTRLVLDENGYRIPRVSRDQAKVGTSVTKSSLRLGDLVFFDTKGYGKITHVGLYLGGNLMVHASSSKGVTLVLFSNRYFQSRYVSARRIVRYR